MLSADKNDVNVCVAGAHSVMSTVERALQGAMPSARRYPLGPYGLTIVLSALFLTTWAAQTYAGWRDFSAEQKAHGEVPQVTGDSGYVWHWLAQTMENWQSEFLQLLTFVALTATLVHRGSPESRDSDDETQERLQRIEELLLKSRTS